MKIKDVISKYKGMSKQDLQKALTTVEASQIREKMSVYDDPTAHGRLSKLKYEKAVISNALKVTTK
ncbi:MAG: hypothetical protein U0525_01030 [Patescibacteria group bacterium]